MTEGASSVPDLESEDAGLRIYIKAEGIKLPRELRERATLRVVGYILFAHFWIAVAVLAGRYLPNVPAVLAVGFVSIVIAQRCTQTLVHHLSHDMASKRRERNDLIGNLLIAGLTGMRVQNYRRVHFIHHAENGSTADPEFFDIEVVRQKGGLLRYILHFAGGGEALTLFAKYYAPGKARTPAEARAALSGTKPQGGLRRLLGRAMEMTHVLLAQLTLVLLFTFVANAWYLYLVWIYVAVSWSPLLSRLRFLVEHPGKDERTVSTRAPWYETLFFSPYQFNYHFEHHVWPSLPPYYLKRMHEQLRNDGFFERHPEYVAQSFVRSLKQSSRQS